VSLTLSRPVARARTWRLHHVAQLWRAMRQAAISRRALAEMTDHDLRDLGIGRADAQFEANRHAWDLGERPR